MKRFFACLVFSLFALPITAGVNTRVTRVIDSRNLLLENGTTVTLRGVDVPAADESAATEYLTSLVANTPVFVDNGDVYRSPDALYVNAQMAQHLWRHHERYLGLSLPAPHTTRAVAPAPTPKPQRILPPRRHRYQRVRK